VLDDADRNEWNRHVGFDPCGDAEQAVLYSALSTDWSLQLERKVLGELKFKMKTPVRYLQLLEEWSGRPDWPPLEMYSDGGADAAGTEWAQAEYGWVVSLGGDELDVVAEGTAPVWGPAEDMDSNRAELYGLIAGLRRVRLWEGKLTVWVDN
jgi:hypothetical protein